MPASPARPGTPLVRAGRRRVAVESGPPVAVHFGPRAGSVDVFSALLIGAVVSAVIAAVPVI